MSWGRRPEHVSAHLAHGNDWRVTTPSAWEAIAVTLARADPGRETDLRIGLHWRLDVPTMFDAHTADSAFPNDRDDDTTRLVQGFAADRVVLDEDRNRQTEGRGTVDARRERMSAHKASIGKTSGIQPYAEPKPVQTVSSGHQLDSM